MAKFEQLNAKGNVDKQTAEIHRKMASIRDKIHVSGLPTWVRIRSELAAAKNEIRKADGTAANNRNKAVLAVWLSIAADDQYHYWPFKKSRYNTLKEYYELLVSWDDVDNPLTPVEMNREIADKTFAAGNDWEEHTKGDEARHAKQAARREANRQRRAQVRKKYQDKGDSAGESEPLQPHSHSNSASELFSPVNGDDYGTVSGAAAFGGERPVPSANPGRSGYGLFCCWGNKKSRLARFVSGNNLKNG